MTSDVIKELYLVVNQLEKSKFNITSDNFSLMSIDIDSFDYYVFNSIEKYFHKVPHLYQVSEK